MVLLLKGTFAFHLLKNKENHFSKQVFFVFLFYSIHDFFILIDLI